MIQRSGKRDGIVSSRTCLVALLIILLIFPPWMFGDQIGWAGGSGAYTDNNWNCATCTPSTYPNNGNDGLSFDAAIQSGSGINAGVSLNNIEQGIDAVTVDSMTIRSGDAVSTAALTVGGGLPPSGHPNLTIGTPNNTQGHALYVGGLGTLNVGDGGSSATVALDLSGGGGSIYPGAANSVGAYIANGGTLNVTGLGFLQSGSTLQVLNTSGGTRSIGNDGSINIGADGSFSTLQFSNAGAPVSGNFVLRGSGSVTMGGFSGITGTSGLENLTNDFGHTITANGINTIGGNLASFTNNGTLAVAGPGPFGGPASLEVTAPLINYNTVTGKLTNGTYNVQNGGTLILDSVGPGNSISSLDLVNMQLSGPGASVIGGINESVQGSSLHTGAVSGFNPTATSALTHLTDSSLDLQGITTTITPSNGSGTLYLRSDPLGIPTNLTVEQDSNENISNVEIAGNVKNISSAYGAPEQTPSPVIGATTIQGNGSNINVSGSTLTIDGTLTNQAYGTSALGGFPAAQWANSNVNVINGGTLNVGGDLITLTNASGNSFINVHGYDDNQNSVGASLNVTGNLRNGGGFGNPLSQGDDVVAVQGGSLTVNGNFTNNNTYGTSSVYVDSASTVNVTGWFGQFQNGGSTGQSVLTIDGGQMTVGNLRNSTGAFNADQPNFAPQSQVTVTNGGSLTINGNFANVDANGVLLGGAYNIGGPSIGSNPVASTLNYNGADITAIGANTSLTLGDNQTGMQGQILNNGHDAVSGSLNEVTGSLILFNGASLNLTSSQGLTIDASGQVSIQPGGNGSLSATSLTNNGTLSLESGSNTVTVGTLGNLTGGVLSGGNWNLDGQLYFGQGTDGSTSVSQINNAVVGLGPNGGLFNGTSGSSTDALQTLSSIVNNAQLGISGQTRTFGPLNVDASILNLGGSTVTFSGPQGGNGTGLSLTNNAILNVSNGSAILDLSGGNGASVNSGSTLNVGEAGTLVLSGGNEKSPGVVDLTGGGLNLFGTSTGGALSVADGGVYQLNGGAIVLGQSGQPLGAINVSSGNLTVNSDGSGGGSVNLTGASQLIVASGNLTINSTLTNWTSAANATDGLGTLTGGQYIVGDGGTMQLSGIGVGNSVQELNGASVSVTGHGLLTGDGTTNALLGLTQIDAGSTATLRNLGNITITPGTSNAGANTFYLNNQADSGSAPTLNLRSGTNVQLNGNFQSFGGNLNITDKSSLNIGGSFNNVDLSGALGSVSGTALPINLMIGSGSSLTYTGADITSIESGSTLTLGDREGFGTGTMQNLNGGQHDALSNSLNTVNGTLNLQNGASLALGAAAGSFLNNGNVTVTNGSTFDVSAVSFGNVDGSGNLSGNFFIGTNSTLSYSGVSNIVAIQGNLTLDNNNSGKTGTITNNGADALSGSLSSLSLGAGLNLQNGAGLTLTGAQPSFTAGLGNVNITNRSTFDVSALGSNFLDVDGSGNLNGNYLIGSNSAFNYSGANITAINGQVTLDNANNGATGKITNNGAEALTGSLTAINGTLSLQNGAQLELNNGVPGTDGQGNPITVYTPLALNAGAVLNLDQNGQGGSVLNVDEKLSSYNASINLGVSGNASGSLLYANNGFSNKSDDNNSDTFGNSVVRVTGSGLAVTNNLFNGAFTPNQGYANAEIDLDQASSATVSGDLKNLALYGTPTDGVANSTASVNLTNGSSLTVSGNVKNIAGQGQVDQSGTIGTMATISLDGGSNLTVNGTYTNYSGGFTGLASLNLSNNSTAVITGLFNNSGGSEVDIDDFGASGSTLTAQGGFRNHNAAVFLNNNSTLNVTGGFRNLSDDSANAGGIGESVLELGSSGGAPLTLASGAQIRTNFTGVSSGSVATITGGLTNSAVTSNGGNAMAGVLIGFGSTLNVDNLTNIATVATPGANDYAEADVVLSGGTLNVTGNVSNGYTAPVFQNANLQAPGSLGYSTANIISNFSTINVGGSFNNANGEVDLSSGSQLNSYNGFLNAAADTTFDVTAPTLAPLSGYSDVLLEGESGAFIKGGLTNSATSAYGGFTQATLTIADGSQMTITAPTSSPTQGIVYALTNLASATSSLGDPGAASAITTISNGSGLTVNGNVLNMSVVSGGSASGIGPLSNGAVMNVTGDGSDTLGGSTLLVAGTFNNTAATLNVSGGSTATIAGLFTNDARSVVNLTESDPVVGLGTQGLSTGHSSFAGSLPPTQLITNGGFNNAGAVNLNDNTALVDTGTFINTGNVSIGNGSILLVNEDANNGNLSEYNQSAGTTTIVAGGALQADNVNITGGTVQGVGTPAGGDQSVATVYGNLTVGSDGSQEQGSQTATLDLGDPMALDVIGDYDQTMLGLLNLSLDGVGNNGAFPGSDDSNNAYDQVDVNGNITALDGTLNLNLEDGFYASVIQGDYFNILNWTGTDFSGNACIGSADIGCFGTFNNLTFTDSLGNLDTFVEQINTDANGHELDLVVVATSATPEPGTLSMLFCAMLIGAGVTWYRRKRKNVAE